MGSVVAAFTDLGLAIPDAVGLRSFVGPPLPDSMLAHGVAPERIDGAIAAYRRHFEAGGMWENEVYSGIPEQLRLLREAGFTLAVATSKPEIYARPICERFGLSDLVDGVFGAPLDHVPSSKASVIAHALHDLGPALVPTPERVLMVGDRHHDVAGAAEHGFACFGVAWGYAEPGELSDAVAIDDEVSALAALVIARLS